MVNPTTEHDDDRANDTVVRSQFCLGAFQREANDAALYCRAFVSPRGKASYHVLQQP
jgi:hypothetical protein